MRKQKSRVQVSVTALGADMSNQHVYTVIDAYSRQVIAMKIYNAVSQQNMTDFLKSLNKTDSGLTL